MSESNVTPFWTYIPKQQKQQQDADQFANQARQFLTNRNLPESDQTPTIFDPLPLDKSEMDAIQPDLKRPPGQPPGGHGLLRTVGNVLGDTGLFAGPVDQPWDVLRPIARLQGLENRYIAKPAAETGYSILTAGPNAVGAGLPDYSHLPAILRTGLETLTAPSTWLTPGVLGQLTKVAPGLSAVLPAADSLFIGLGSKRAVASTIAGAFAFPAGTAAAQAAGLGPAGGLIGGLAATHLATAGFGPRSSQALLSAISEPGSDVEVLKDQLRWTLDPANRQAAREAQQALDAENAARVGRSDRSRKGWMTRRLNDDLQDSLILTKVRKGEALAEEELPRAQALLNNLDRLKKFQPPTKSVVSGNQRDFNSMSDEELNQLTKSSSSPLATAHNREQSAAWKSQISGLEIGGMTELGTGVRVERGGLNEYRVEIQGQRPQRFDSMGGAMRYAVSQHPQLSNATGRSADAEIARQILERRNAPETTLRRQYLSAFSDANSDSAEAQMRGAALINKIKTEAAGRGVTLPSDSEMHDFLAKRAIADENGQEYPYDAENKLLGNREIAVDPDQWATDNMQGIAMRGGPSKAGRMELEGAIDALRSLDNSTMGQRSALRNYERELASRDSGAGIPAVEPATGPVPGTKLPDMTQSEVEYVINDLHRNLEKVESGGVADSPYLSAAAAKSENAIRGAINMYTKYAQRTWGLESGSAGAARAPFVETSWMQTLLDKVKALPGWDQRIDSAGDIVADADAFHTITNRGREFAANAISSIPNKTVSDQLMDFVTKGLGLRLKDSDASAIVGARGRLHDMLQSYSAAGGDAVRATMGKAFDIDPKTDLAANVRALPGTPQGYTAPTTRHILQSPSSFNLTADQKAAVVVARKQYESMAQLAKAFNINDTLSAPWGPMARGRTQLGFPNPVEIPALKNLPDAGAAQVIEAYMQQVGSTIESKWYNRALESFGLKPNEVIQSGEASRPGQSQDILTKLNNLFRGTMATADLSFSAIQGMLGLFHSPEIWGSAFKNAFTSEGYRDLVARMAEKGTLENAVKDGVLYVGDGSIGEFMARGPFTLIPGAKQLANWSNTAFSRFGNSMRLMQYDTHLPLANTLSERRDLARWVNLMTGYSPNKPTSLETMMFFAPRFFRSQLGLLSDALSTGEAGSGQISRDLARQTLIKTMAGAALLTYGVNEMLGNKTEWSPVKRTPDGSLVSNPNFMRIRALGQDISLLGPWDTLMRTASIAATQGPIKAASYFGTSKASPVLGRVYDLIRHQTLAGDPVELGTTQGLLSAIGREVEQLAIPISAQNALQNVQSDHNIPRLLGVTALQATGLKSSDLTSSEKRDVLAKDTYGAAWSQLDPSQRAQLQTERPEIVSPKARTDYQKALATRQQIAKTVSDRQAQIDATIPPGKKWLDARSDLLKWQSGAYDQWASDNPDIATFNRTTKADNPNLQALEDYWNLFDQAHTENWDAPTIAQHVDALQSNWSPDQQAYVDRNTGVHDTPQVKAYRQDQRTILRPYFALQDQVWAQMQDKPVFSQYKSLDDYITAKTQELIDGGLDPATAIRRVQLSGPVKSVQNVANALQTRYRRAHPETDAALAKWYGYTPLRLQHR